MKFFKKVFLLNISILIIISGCNKQKGIEDDSILYNRMIKQINKYSLKKYVFLEENKYDKTHKNTAIYDVVKDSLTSISTIINTCEINQKRFNLNSDSIALYGTGEAIITSEETFVVVWFLCKGGLYLEYYNFNGEKLGQVIEGGHSHAKAILSKDKMKLFVFDFDSYYEDIDKYSTSQVKVYNVKTHQKINEFKKLKIPELRYYLMGLDDDEKYLFLFEDNGKLLKIEL